jgi:hypothetical protein
VRRDDLRAVAALVAVWAAAVVLVDPRADVSILDDWCYAISVEQILHGQGFHVSPWSSTFPPVQLWWGTLFAWLGGFSFTALRRRRCVCGSSGRSARTAASARSAVGARRCFGAAASRSIRSRSCWRSAS